MDIVFYKYELPSETALELQNGTFPDLRVRFAESTDDIANADAVFFCKNDIPKSGAYKKILIAAHSIFSYDDIIKADADGIIFEPFNATEMLARAMLSNAPVNRIFEKNGLKIDFAYARAEANGSTLHLTMQEYKLLCLLANNHEKTVPYGEILSFLWESPVGNEMDTVRVFVNSLRKKLSAYFDRERIKTVTGKGYALV